MHDIGCEAYSYLLYSLRVLKSSTSGAIFGVETSADKQLHLNAVINSKNKLLVSPFQSVARRVGVQISLKIQELTTATDIRRATAYSLVIASNGDFLKHPDDDNTAPTRLVVPDKL
jgi:hypothetical protein